MTRHLSRTPGIALLALCLAVSPIAYGGKTPDVVEDALAFALTDRDKAVQLLEDAIQAGPSSRDLDTITVHAGEQRRLAGDSDLAHRWFSDVLGRTEKGAAADGARLGLALLQAGNLDDPRTAALLEDVSEKSALDTQNADRFALLAIRAHNAGDNGAEGGYARKALGYAKEDPAVFQRIRATLDALAAGEAPPEQVVVGPRRGSPLDRADAALTAGKADDARRIAEDVLKDAPAESADHRAAAYLLRRIDGASVNARKVAVLLPLQGKYGAVGAQVRQALEFGHKGGGAPFALEFVESGATPESAVAALEKAVIDDGAIAVVGPLLSDETDAVVAAADALRVPLLSLSQSLEETEGTTWVVQAMMTPGDQIDALLSEVMGPGQMDAFAVFAPKNPYGERVAALFDARVAERGGKITVERFYDPEATDLIPFAKDLGRKDYKARAAEFWDLKRAAKEKGGNPDRVVLPPVIDFDAIFLPDSAARLPIACAALAYEEFPMGDFLPTKESPSIPLLGLSSWNNAQLVARGGPYTRRSYFTDAFLNEMPVEEPPWVQSEAQAAFVERYREATGRTPTPLEAVVVDIGGLLANAGKARPADRATMRDALVGATLPAPVAGTHGIDPETHRARRDLLILSISEDAIVPRAELPTPEVER